jgi:putative N6-adenine-specific DNA methylase
MSHPKTLPRRELVAICAPGLEEVVASELASLGWPGPRTAPGVVSCIGGATELYRACLFCRSATDLRVRVGRLQANNLEALAHGLGALPWSLFAESGQEIDVKVSSRGSRLKRKDAVARKAALAIGDALRGPRLSHLRPRRRTAPLTVHLRIEQAQVEASVDPVGDALWKRGWRQRGGAAPLRENLAAASLLALGWRPERPLVDPFCGSGTLLIEAASLATGRAAGSERSYALESWPCHEPKRWRSLQQSCHGGSPTARPTILGADADAAVLEIARQNARRAKVDRLIRWSHQPIEALEPPAPGPGLVLANPPWGQRLGRSVHGVYRSLGERLRNGFGGWELALLCPDRQLANAVGLPLEPRLGFPNGGLRLTLWVGRVPGASSPSR